MEKTLYFEMFTRGAPPASKDNYFKVSMWGMNFLRNMMTAASILDWETDIDDNEFPTELPEDKNSDEYQQAVKLITDLLSIQSPISGQVPGIKFATNDRWIVTPVECLFIVEGLDKFLSSLPEDWEIMDDDGKPLPKDTVDQVLALTSAWCEYNRTAAKYNGYMVD